MRSKLYQAINYWEYRKSSIVLMQHQILRNFFESEVWLTKRGIYILILHFISIDIASCVKLFYLGCKHITKRKKHGLVTLCEFYFNSRVSADFFPRKTLHSFKYISASTTHGLKKNNIPQRWLPWDATYDACD